MTNKKTSKASKLSRTPATPRRPRQRLVPSLKQIFKPAQEFLDSLTPAQIESINASAKAELEKITTVSFKLTYRQLDQLEEMCQGATKTDYIKAVLFGGRRPKAKRLPGKVNRDTYLELSRIGNNINQMAHGINAAVKHGFQPLTDDVQQVLDCLEQTQVLIAQARRELSGAMDDDWEPESHCER